MLIRVLHAAPVRLLLVLVGTALFVESSADWSLTGLVLGTVIVIASGADVAYSPRESVGHA
jgi:hypothetical protein